MRHFYKAALLGVALAVGGCASAAMTGPHDHGTDASPQARQERRHDMQGPMMSMQEPMGMTPLVGCHGARGDVEARLANLRTDLQIAPAQASAWDAYAAAFRTHAGHMDAGMMGMMGASGDAPTPPVVERLRHHEAMMSQHFASFQSLRAAIEPLYASFSAEQRAEADALRCNRPS